MKTITFYSYKGGVGRSLALANIASRLSEYSRQVCLLDFDLEAPGLHYKFSSYLYNRGIEINKGLVDYIYQFTNNGNLPERIAEYSYSFLSQPRSYTTLIPAGNINSSDYWKKLSSIDWYNLLYENPSGLSFLLDSRTGISEMSGITLSLLADEVVVVAANNRENLEGAKKIIKSITDPKNVIIGKTPKITFVLSRIPLTDDPEDKEKEQNLIAKIKREFGNLIDDVNIIHSDRDLEENEQIKIGYEIDDSVAQISRDYLRLFNKLTADELKPDEINGFKNIKDSEKEFQKALTESMPTNNLKYIDKAIELNPLNKEFKLYRASIYDKLEEWENAIKDCENITSEDTNNLLAYEIKGQALLKLKEYSKAKITFETILGFDKNRISAKLALAEIFAQEKDYKRSITYYNEIIEKDVENPIGYTRRSNIKLLIGDDYHSALDDVYNALQYDSECAEAFNILAEINALINNRNEFYINLEKALKLDAKMVESTINSKKIYKSFFNENRFIRVLEKYNIQFETEDNK